MLLSIMDEQGIQRVGMVNYPSPNIMGFSDDTNGFAARYAEADPVRLLPYGGVDPVTTRDAAAGVERLLELARVCSSSTRRTRRSRRTTTRAGSTALATIY